MQSILKSLRLGERVEDKVATLGKKVLGASQERLKRMKEWRIEPVCTCSETFHKIPLEEYEKIKYDYVMWKRLMYNNSNLYSYDTVSHNYHIAKNRYESVRPCPYCVFTFNPNNRRNHHVRNC
jgi:uncharacterized CHY-type Zn-finger protein